MTSRRIRQLRAYCGLSQGELARRLGVARATVTRWENGTRRPSHVAALAMRSAFENRDEGNWPKLISAALNELWDNSEDAVYDEWRARYRPRAR